MGQTERTSLLTLGGGRMTIEEITEDGAECLIQVSQWMGKLLDRRQRVSTQEKNPTQLRQRCNGLGGKTAPMVYH